MRTVKQLSTWIFFGALVLSAACSQSDGAQVVQTPTLTLAPILSQTARVTATPVMSNTPLPTFTYTPSRSPVPPTPSNTFTPSPTPEIVGIVSSLQAVNLRSGPSESFDIIAALPAGTGVTVLGQNPEGTWYNVRMENGDEGWISSRLLRVDDPPTPLPSATATPNLTSLALGTPLPTNIFGTQISPTPPRSVSTPTPAASEDILQITIPPNTNTPSVPIIDTTPPVINVSALNMTASALAPTGAANNSGATATFTPFGATSGGGTTTGGTTGGGSASVQQGVDVFALCDDRRLAPAAPTNIASGSTIEVVWAWFAATREQVQQHLDAVSYEVRIDGNLLTNWRNYAQRIREEGGQFVVYFYVPYGPITSGQHIITYRATWTTAIFDGTANFGPGTTTPVEEGGCTFSVR